MVRGRPSTPNPSMSTAPPYTSRRVGDRALLIELPDNALVHAAAELVRACYGEALVEVVPGHQTLLVVGRDGPVRIELDGLEAADETPHALVQIAVRYDGADLEAVASALGTSAEGVVALHTGPQYTVAFMGFAPGFPYLICEQPSPLLQLPRRASPRTRVPAGSVAVAAGYCGIYPQDSPGGWNLLGHTGLRLFDAGREPPALLEPGARVRFEPIRG
jgi:KipI family sensor histidine kinase inhibitor